jgi:glutamate-ammonia-ligase adenylyltransferase
LDPATVTSRIAFQDAERAGHTLARVAAQLPPGLKEALPNLLAESPDPDSALNLLERLCAEAGGEVLRLMDRHRYLLHYAIAVFGQSPWLGDTLLQNRDLFHALQRDRNLERSHSGDDYQESLARFRSRTVETDVAQLLARFKRREYIRIMLRDVLGIATLAETTAEISALSDVLIEEAARDSDAALRSRFGPPQHADSHGRVVEAPFAVLSLGKLGGNELNYSSDVDLMFLYGDGEPDPPGATSNREYFIRLAQGITEVLSRPTREGAVFRIDLRLRPQGREGESAVALGHAVRYYSQHAQDWELQALIKVRHSAGDVTLAREFIRGAQPYVYRRELNFSAIETALDTRERIRRHRRAARGGIDVKLDRGGIRDIEFLVQCLQRVYGGAEPWLRSGGTLFSLQKLHDKQHLDGKDFHDLNGGYEFLRRVEHRLQLRRGRQTHQLPDSEAELRMLERAVFEQREHEARPPRLTDAVRERMAAVAEIYARLIHSQQPPREEADAFHLKPLPAQAGREQSYNQILHRLATDAPALYQVATRRELSTHARRNLHRFLSAAFTSAERYAAVVRDPCAVEHALRLFSVSDYLTDTLIHHPVEIATIAEIAEQPSASAGEGPLLQEEEAAPGAADPVFRHIGEVDAPYSEKLALLRQQYRHRVFAACARDLMEFRPVYQSLQEMSEAADLAIAAAARIVGVGDSLAVLALGRLGSSEFDVASDADLLFVRDETSDPGVCGKAAEQVVEALAAYTRDGTVFAVDPRLRPRGAEGELVATPSSLAAYFASEAHPWEALTYTKLRFVAGSEDLGGRAMTAVHEQLRRFAADSRFAQEVSEMRARLEASEDRGNFKTAPGGFYDIDFVASYLLIRHSAFELAGNTREKLYALAASSLLDDNSCATLDSAAELLRTLEHVVRLILGRPRKALPVAEQARETTERLTARFLDRNFPGGLEAELARSARSVRQVYEQVLGQAATAL